MPFDVGDSVPIAWDVKDGTGTLVTAANATLTVTLPDGTTTNPTIPVPSSAGQYRVTFTPTLEGRHVWRAVTTGPNTSIQDVFEVRQQASPSLISIAEAKVGLNIPATTTTFDDELREYCEAVTRVVEDFVGPIVRRTVTRRCWGYAYSVRLPHTQILSITSIVLVRDGSQPITISDLAVDPLTGIVTYKNGITRFPYGDLDFTYVIGRTYVEPNWTLAAKEILQSNWRSQLGNLPAVQGEEDNLISTNQSVPFFISKTALALLSYDNTSLGFA